MRNLYIGVLILGLTSIVAQHAIAADPTYEENLKRGAETTKKNYLNNPFHQPSKITSVNDPTTWPIYYNRGPIDRSPSDKTTKILTLGTGTPAANTYRFGPAHALIVNGYPYFIDCGEGWWRAINRSMLGQPGLDLTNILGVNQIKYLFVTHLHEDHTVGLPSFILSPYKWGSHTDKVIFGPVGTESLVGSIVKGWHVDRQEMPQGSTHQSPEGSGATVGEVNFNVEYPGPIFEDDNVIVEAFPTKHGALCCTLAFRFTAKSDGRVVVFGGDGRYSEGLVQASKGADVLVMEGVTDEDIKYATWGGDDLEKRKATIGAYHMFPKVMKQIQDESGVKEIVMVHEQDWAPPEKYKRLNLLHEMQRAGVKNIYSAMDGDLY